MSPGLAERGLLIEAPLTQRRCFTGAGASPAVDLLPLILALTAEPGGETLAQIPVVKGQTRVADRTCAARARPRPARPVAPSGPREEQVSSDEAP